MYCAIGIVTTTMAERHWRLCHILSSDTRSIGLGSAPRIVPDIFSANKEYKFLCRFLEETLIGLSLGHLCPAHFFSFIYVQQYYIQQLYIYIYTYIYIYNNLYKFIII